MSISTASRAARQDHPCLPDGMGFNHVVELIERHARRVFGIGLARRDALMRMMRSTSTDDWINPGRDPVCYRAQQDIAAELGITDRALRIHERALEQLGLVEIDTGADGRRSGVELSGGRRLGINFRPLIERLELLDEIDYRHREEARRLQALRLECSALKRDVRRAIEALIERHPKHSDLPKILRAFAALPRRYAGFRSIEALEEHLSEIQAVHDQVIVLLSCREESSGVAEAQLPAIINTTLKDSVFCSGSSAYSRPARKRADDHKYGGEPCGSPECIEKDDCRPGQGRKPELTETFTPRELYVMASDDMRLYLDAFTGPENSLEDWQFIKAAISILPDLGVHPTAWEEAAETMGNLAAALTILVIDANRFRAVEPVRQPGAMLRAMTRIARRGGLNLHGSLIKLKQWKIYNKVSSKG